MAIFTRANSNPQFQPGPNPNFQYQDLGPTLDSVYNNYMRSRQDQRAETSAGLQDQASRGQIAEQGRRAAAQDFEETAQFGAPLQSFSPQQIEQAGGSSPLGGTGMMTADNPMRDKLTRLREGLLKLGGRDPQTQAAQGLKIRGAEADIGKTEAEAYRILHPIDRQTGGAKAAEDLRELQVPGYRLDESKVRPLPVEAKDLRTGTAAVQDFTNGVDRLKELIQQHGSTNMAGEGSGEMATLAANLKLTLKEVQKLGVLSASDIAFLEAQVFDPTSIKSWGSRTGTALKQLDTINARARSGLAESLKSRGYSPDSGNGGGIETRRLKNGQAVRVQKQADGSYVEVP